MSIRNRVAWRAKLLRSPENSPFNPWLRDRGSLTAHLQAKGQFVVRVLRQGLAMPTSDEAIALGIKRDQLVWVREVALLCAGEPLVFAHSLLPCRPRGPMTRWLARLDNRSLGALLFAHPGFARGTIHGKRLDHRHALFHPALEAMGLAAFPPPHLWARRSRFAFGAQSVLVTEVFAPALINA
jgi:chorismate--pyruvate lyase